MDIEEAVETLEKSTASRIPSEPNKPLDPLLICRIDPASLLTFSTSSNCEISYSGA